MHTNRSLAAFVLGLALCAAARPQDFVVQARRAGDQAQALAKAGRWREAEAPLREALARLAVDDQTREARAVLQFNLGWVLSRQARSQGADGERARTAAAEAYRAVLRDFPDNAQAAVNLSLLLESTQPEAALDVLEKAEQVGSTDAPRVGLARADLLIRRGEASAAWDVLWSLAMRDWSQAAAHERLVRLYPLLPRDRDQSLYDYCLRLDQTGFSPLAGQGMGDLVRLNWKSNSALAEEALFHWVVQQVRQGQLTPELLGRLPAPTEWPSPALIGLSQLASGRLQPDGWWLAKPERAHVASGILRVIADRAAAEGRNQEAVTLYKLAMSCAPGVEAYNQGALRGQRAAKLDAAIPLARLLHRNREAPGNDAELKAVLDGLWDEKTQEYRKWNRLGIIQYHRVLGIIHTEEGEYSRADYHLRRLLEFEQGLARDERRPPNPLPEVHAMLALGAEHRGDLAQAADQRLQSAKGYLLLSDPKAAQRSLAAVRDDGKLPAAQRAEVSRLKATTANVERFATLPPDQKAEVWNKLLETAPESPPQSSQLDKEWQAKLLLNLTYQAEAEALQQRETNAALQWRKAQEDVEKRFRAVKPAPSPELQKRVLQMRRLTP